MLRGLLTLVCVAPALLSPPMRPPAGPLPFYYDLYTFRGTGGATTVVAAFAVAAGNLAKEEIDGLIRYRFDVTLVLADTALQTVSRTDDSVYVPLSRPLADAHLLSTHIEVQAPPSRTTVQRVIMSDATTPGVGQLYGSDFPIPDYGGDSLMLSDIALGQPDVRGGWRRGAATIALLPTSQFPGSAFDVYYEIYNLPRGHAYRTEIMVQREEERAPEGDPVRVAFEGVSGADADRSLAELRRVEASLANGRYRITVTIRDRVSGASVSRSRTVEVKRWVPGAVLMPAWPHGRGQVRLPGR